MNADMVRVRYVWKRSSILKTWTELVLRILVIFGICLSIAPYFEACAEEVASGLPPGDWIVNPKTKKPEPFYPNHKKSDFVKGCENSPGITKNLQQIGKFIPTAIMGNDSRCPYLFDENASEEEKTLYGVGEFFDFSRKCVAMGGKTCAGTGHLVIDGDIAITAAHVFLNYNNGETDKYVDGKGYKFSTKVWIPKDLRKNSDEAYEWRSYEVQEVKFGSLNPLEPDHKDYAFVKLKESVGVSVGKKDANGKIGKKVGVDRKYWPKPLPFKPLDDKRFSKSAQMVGLHNEKRGFYKNCEPFKIYKDPNSGLNVVADSLLALDGDTMDGSSGAAIAVPDENGVLTFTGVNVAERLLPTASDTEGDFHIENRINIAVDGNSFYEEFMKFRRKFGRGETKEKTQPTGSI